MPADSLLLTLFLTVARLSTFFETTIPILDLSLLVEFSRSVKRGDAYV